MALAIGAGLHPVAAQRRHAPPPRRRLRAIEEHPAAFFGGAHLQPVQRSHDGTVDRVRRRPLTARPSASPRAARSAMPAFMPRFRHERKQPHRAVQGSNGIPVLATLGRIAFQIAANAGAEFQRGLEHAGVILPPDADSPRCDIQAPSSRGPAVHRPVRVRHAVMREMPDIERVGEIVEIRQLIRNLELAWTASTLQHQ